MTRGPLAGTTVIEFAGIGPAPFAGMMLADLGADVIRVDRPGPETLPNDIANRGKRSIALDLKRSEAASLILELVGEADVLIEGLRPGVMERLGIGPEECLEANPALVYGRVTGWGQEGPLSTTAGHDINYIALAGALAHMGRAGDKPTPALNMVGDFGGGGMLLTVGVLSALLESRATGEGRVVDAAMVDGAALQMTMIHDLQSRGQWTDARGENLLDTGAPFYDTYETSDGEFVAVGAIEPQFFAALVDGLGWPPDVAATQMDRSSWPTLRQRLADAFASKTRAEWMAIFESTDACVTPVMTMAEALEHPHMRARRSLMTVDGRRMAAPAPRFDGVTPAEPGPASVAGRDTDDVLRSLGMDAERISNLRAEHIVS